MAGSLSGRLGRIRSSQNNRKINRAKTGDPCPLPYPWKRVTPFLSEKETILEIKTGSSFPGGEIVSLFSELKDVDLKNIIFYDLETTGLSGGAGTIAFLAGFGRIESESLYIKQFFLHDFPGETDFLQSIGTLLTPDKVLVSYNGKSFDHPLLRTRFLMNRLTMETLAEVDLLHTARRLWKDRLPSCRLGTIEENILNKVRINDIPGKDIPGIYFNYLKNNQKPRGWIPLSAVFDHHLQDIISLAQLFIFIEKLWVDPDSAGVEDAGALGRLMLAKNRTDGITLLKRSWGDGDYSAGRVLSLHYRRTGKISEAAGIWKVMWYRDEGLFPGLELAKYYEHRVKNVNAAKKIVLTLLSKSETSNNERLKKILQYRLNRLKRKESIRRP